MQSLRTNLRYLMHYNRGVFMRLLKFSASNASDVEIYANHFPLKPSLNLLIYFPRKPRNTR